MDSGQDAVHRCARLGDSSMLLKALDAAPSALNSQDPKLGWTPLYRAVICGHHDSARLLLKRGANPNIASRAGDGPLHIAADEGNVRLVKCLLEAKADTQARQSDGETALHKAAAKGHHRVCWLLLRHKADPNAQSAGNLRTPLHLAVVFGRKKVVQLLMTYGGDVNLRDNAGNSVYDLVPNEDIQEALQGQPLAISPSRESFESDLSGTLSPVSPHPQVPCFFQEVPILPFVKISEPADCESEIPQEYILTNGDDEEAVMDGISEFSEKPEDPPMVITKSGSFGFEPESEQSDSPLPSLHRSFSFGADPKKSSMYLWLSKVRLECLFETLHSAGFDDIDSLRNQMNSSIPLDIDGLKKIGVYKPGHRVRLLACLEEEARGRFRRRHVPSEEVGPFHCCRQATSTPGIIFLPTLQHWLDLLNLPHLYSQFVDTGYDDLEHLLALMHTRYLVTDQVLREEVKVTKVGHRQRLLIRLEEDAQRVDSMFRGRSEEEGLEIEREATGVACSPCTLS